MSFSRDFTMPLNSQLIWVGPFTVEQLLRGCIDDAFPKPPLSHSVYVVSLDSWKNIPSRDSRPLYLGSNTGTSERFRTRVGDLMADLFGFLGGEAAFPQQPRSFPRQRASFWR